MLYVYGLIDPITRRIAYIGISSDPDERLKAHMREGRRLRARYGPIGEWIARLADQGHTPQLVILDQGDDEAMVRRETELIRQCRLADPLLCNVNDGAVGRRGRLGVPGAGAPPARGKPKPPGARVYPPKSTMTPQDMRSLRERRGWSQADLAKQLGVHYSAVSLWEAGKRRIPKPVEMSLKLLDIVKAT